MIRRLWGNHEGRRAGTHTGATADWSPADTMPPARPIGGQTRGERRAAADNTRQALNHIEADLARNLDRIITDVEERLADLADRTVGELRRGHVSLIKRGGDDA